MPNKANNKLFADYLAGTLGEQDRLTFEQEMEKDQNLRMSFEAYQDQQNKVAVERHLKQELADAMDDWDLSIIDEEPEEKRSKYIRLVMAVAAALALLLVVAIPLLKNYLQPSFSRGELVASYYTTPKLERTLGGETRNTVRRIEQSNRIDSTKIYIDSLLQESTLETINDQRTIYNLAHRYYKSDNPQDAIDLFDKVAKSGYLYHKHAEWYAILSCLAGHQDIGTINQRLDKLLSKKEHPFKEEAIKLKKDLKSLKD